MWKQDPGETLGMLEAPEEPGHLREAFELLQGIEWGL